MNRYLLDTNVVSELRKLRPHGGVTSWVGRLQHEQMFLSAVTLGELQAGIERNPRRDKAKAEEIEAWVDQLAESHQILPMDSRCFREWARLMEGRPSEIIEDAMIAATARVHRLVVATRNERDFRNFAVEFINPFEVRE